MRANYDIPLRSRCPRCKGWGQFENGAVHGMPWHPNDGTTLCSDCKGSGLNEVARAAALKEARREARKVKANGE